MTIIPGDTYRISISGADSSILVDSWNSVITANIRAGDDSTLVDIYQKKFNGTVDGTLDGIVVNSVGDVVLNPGTEHEAALFLGDVTGNVTGNAAGNHTGTFTGNVHGTDNSVILNHVTKSLNVSNVTTDTFNVTNFSINRIDADSIFADSFTGHVIGDVVGDVTGDTFGVHHGNNIGNVTGDLTGDVTGNVTGNLTGNINSTEADVATLRVSGTGYFTNIETNSFTAVTDSTFGNVTADRFQGNFEGRLTGNLWASETIHVISVDDPQSIGIAGRSNKVGIGKDDGTGEINLNYNLLNNYISLPTSDGHAPHKFFAHRGDKQNPINLNPGDHMNLHSVSGYINGGYKHTGVFGFFINPEKTHSSSDTHANTGFLLSVAGANHGPDLLGKKRVTIDDLGCLRAGILQTGTYTATERTDLSPAAGMIIFNTSVNKFQGYNGTSWVDLS